MIDWCSAQYDRRAGSNEAQAATIIASQHGLSWPQTMYQFQSSQWPTVVNEAARHFKLSAEDRRGLLFDPGAQAHAVARSARTLFPLVSDAQVDEVLQAMEDVATDNAWTSWEGPPP